MLDSRIDELRNFCVKVLSDLISYPTVNPPGESYREISDYFSNILNEIGFKVDVIKVPDSLLNDPEHPRYNVIARMGNGRPVVHFNGHYDVVPAGFGWKTDPFKPFISGGLVYGRGASDMKGGIASIITAAKALADSNARLNGTLELSFTPDEETGGEAGVAYIVEKGIVNPDFAVVAEPSGINNIWIGNKGVAWLLIEVYGKQAHGSTPWRGVNAFEAMIHVADRILRELKPVVERRKSKYDCGDPEGARATIMLGGEVKGGAKVNIVPGYCSFTIDRRVLLEEMSEEAAREIEEFVNNIRIPDVELKVKRISVQDASVVDSELEIVRIAVRSAEDVIGIKPRRTVCMGGLDTRFFQKKGIQAITYGPGVQEVAHMANEYVRIDDVLLMAKIYCRMVSGLMGVELS
ncbi:MAG: M20 family metallopeptidase [Candidatus Methanodesulfokora washburnensis]|jgi:succinyl-diaminopimelate desuccinylase